MSNLSRPAKTAKALKKPPALFQSASNASIRDKLRGGNDMANLVVRNVDDAIVEALKARAGKRGTSAEAEHRRILAQALRKPKKKSFVRVLMEIPSVGKDSDFKRVQD